MNLRKAFSTKASRFSRAIENNDLEEMKYLTTKKSDWIFFKMLDAELNKKITPEMMTVLMRAVEDDDVLQRWSMKRGSTRLIKDMFLMYAVKDNRADIADVVVSGKDNHNAGEAGEHPAEYLLDLKNGKDLAPEKRMEYLRAVLASGTDKIKDADQFMWTAAESGYVEGLKLLSAIGFDLNKDNEKALRIAARGGHSEACAYLVAEKRADIGQAISICEALGGDAQAALFLRGLKDNMPQAQVKAPATVESLAAEVEDLRRTVKTLTTVIEEMRAPEKALDKKPLASQPAPASIRKP
ncbi:MAG: hypothetical protein GC185_00080 [Alphaproteobacteria bacterium]|nr:hypothetical protein [Alphaproteobacteria bacterium]